MKILDLDAELKEGPRPPRKKKRLPGAPAEKLLPERRYSRAPILLGGVALVLVAGAVAWMIFRNWPEEIRFGLDEVQATVDDQFPATGRYLSLVEATVSNPRVGPAASGDHVGMKFDLSLAPPENGPKFSAAGPAGLLERSTRIEVTAGIRYEPESGGVYLEEPLIERMDLRGMPPEFQNRAYPFILEVIESALITRPVYTLRKEDTEIPPARLRMKSFAVKDGEVVIALGL